LKKLDSFFFAPFHLHINMQIQTIFSLTQDMHFIAKRENWYLYQTILYENVIYTVACDMKNAFQQKNK
jgi:hypothetical protein